MPDAKSITVEPAGNANALTVLRRQRTSSRNVMMRLTMSYRGAMASNISRTACCFSAPSGRVSRSHEREVGGVVMRGSGYGAARGEPSGSAKDSIDCNFNRDPILRARPAGGTGPRTRPRRDQLVLRR